MTEPLSPSPPNQPPAASRRRSWQFHVARAAVITLVLAILVVSAGVGVLTSLLSGGNTRLSRQLVVLLNRSVGTDSTRLEIGRVSGTLFRGAILDHPRLVVRTPEGEVTWASAQRVTIDYDLFGVLFAPNRSFTAVIDSPTVHLVYDKSGRLVFPRFASHPARRSAGPTTRVSIAARNGSFSIERHRVRFVQVQGRGILTLAPGQSTLALDELSGLPDPASRSRGRVRAKGAMTVVGPSLRIDPLDLAYGDSRVRAHLEWDLRKGRVADGLFTLAPLRVGDVSRLVGAGSSEGNLRGEVSFTGIPTDGRATACLTGTFNGETLDTLAVTAALAPRDVTFSGLRIRVRGAEATGGGIVHIGGSTQAALTFHGLDPAAIPWWKAPDGMPRGALAGTARVVVRPTKPRNTVVALVDLDQSRFGRMDVRRGSLQFVSLADGAAVLDSGWVDVPGGRLAGKGRIAPDQTLEAHLIATIDDLRQMNALMEPVGAESGRGRITADLSGPLRTPSFTARAALWQGRLSGGVAYDSLLATAAGRLGSGGSAHAALWARQISAGGRPLGNAVAEVSVGKTIVIERYVQTSGDSTLSFRGTITPGKTESIAVLDSLSLSAGGLRFRNLAPVRLTIAEGHVRSGSVPLDTRPGRLDLAFDWDVKGSRIVADGTLRGLEAARIPGAAASGDSLRGEMQGRFRIAGPLSDPNVALDVDVLRPTWAGVAGDSLSVALDYQPGTLRIDKARYAAGSGRLSVTGTIHAPVPLQTWLQALGRRDESWAKNASLNLDVRAEALDLARFAPADTSLRTLEGTLTFTAQILGTGLEPVAAVQATSPRIAYRGLEGAVTGADLAYALRILRINRFDVNQGGSVSSITGEVPMDLSFFGKGVLRDRPLKLTVRVTDADFKLAALLSPYIAESGGKVSVMAGVSGTPRTPAMQGTVRLRDARVRLAGREEIVEKIELEGTFDQNQLAVTSMSGTQGSKGKITGSGTWQWGGLPPERMVPVAAGPAGQYKFLVKATNFTVTDRDSYLMQLTGAFTVANGKTEDGRQIPFITGTAVLSKGNLTLDLAARDREEVALPFYYDISVEVPGGLFYRTVDSEVELQGTLRLLNKGEGNLALGTMTVRKGRYYLFTREIRNLTGDFIFSSLDRTDPELAVDGETTVPKGNEQLVIKVSLTGRASRPVVHLWDPNNVLSEAELWKALTYGQFVGEYSGQDPSAPITSGVSDLVIQGYLFRNAERWLTQSGWIDTFDLRTGSRSGDKGTAGPLDVGVVGAGKYVTRDLYLNYSQEFSGQGEKRVGAEYRVTRHLLLRGERTERQPLKGSTLPGEEYNLDLKVRLEY
jgi:TamB, inner membrane protein subunit of TAM complex